MNEMRKPFFHVISFTTNRQNQMFCFLSVQQNLISWLANILIDHTLDFLIYLYASIYSNLDKTLILVSKSCKHCNSFLVLTTSGSTVVSLFALFMSSLSLTDFHTENEPKSPRWSVVQISENSLIQTSQFVNKNCLTIIIITLLHVGSYH